MSQDSNLILETIPEFFFLWDVNTKEIIYLSPAFYKLEDSSITGFKNNLILKEYIHPDERGKMDEIFDELPAKDYKTDIEIKANNKKFPVKWLRFKTYPVPNEGKAVDRVVGQLTNISEEKEHICSLKKSVETSEDILHIIAHDLRSPLNNISAFAKMMESERQQERYSDFEYFIGTILKLTDEAQELLLSILNLIELEEAEPVLSFKETDLAEFIKSTTNFFLEMLKDKELRFECYFPQQPILVSVDKVKFGQVIKNLLSNAVKFTKAGGIIYLKAENDSDKVVLSISDTGIGIPEEKIDSIFQKFRFRRKGLRGEKSTGLGLAISKKIVELHKGKIWAESKEGKGTTFYVEIPSLSEYTSGGSRS